MFLEIEKAIGRILPKYTFQDSRTWGLLIDISISIPTNVEPIGLTGMFVYLYPLSDITQAQPQAVDMNEKL
jgi:hypothetical protein